MANKEDNLLGVDRDDLCIDDILLPYADTRRVADFYSIIFPKETAKDPFYFLPSHTNGKSRFATYFPILIVLLCCLVMTPQILENIKTREKNQTCVAKESHNKNNSGSVNEKNNLHSDNSIDPAPKEQKNNSLPESTDTADSSKSGENTNVDPISESQLEESENIADPSNVGEEHNTVSLPESSSIPDNEPASSNILSNEIEEPVQQESSNHTDNQDDIVNNEDTAISSQPDPSKDNADRTEKQREAKTMAQNKFDEINKEYRKGNYLKSHSEYILLKSTLEKNIEDYGTSEKGENAPINHDFEVLLDKTTSRIYTLETQLINEMMDTAKNEADQIREQIAALQGGKTNKSLLTLRRVEHLDRDKKNFHDTIETYIETLDSFISFDDETKSSSIDDLIALENSVKSFQAELDNASEIYKKAQKAIEDHKFLRGVSLIDQIPIVNETYTEKVHDLRFVIASQGGAKIRLHMKNKSWPGFQFRWCPPGSFKMGGAKSSDNPVRLINIENGFWILETEVTQAMWENVMGTKPFAFSADRFQSRYEYLPAENISFTDCLEFCKRLTERLDIGDCIVSLPTESEWEYACNSGKNSESVTEKYLPTAKTQTSKVKTGGANPWGIYDMLGNVAEFCLHDGTNADENEETHLIKGGDWQMAKDSSIDLTPYYRSTVNGNEVSGRTGFRIVIKDNPKVSESVNESL